MGNTYSFVELSTNATLLFPDSQAPSSYKVMDSIAFYTACICLMFYVYMLYVLLRRVQEFDRSSDSIKRVVHLLIANCSTSGVFALLGIVRGANAVGYDSSIELCVWICKHFGALYVLAKWFLYLVLIQREKAVSGSLRAVLGAPGKIKRLIRGFTSVIGTFGPPILALILYIFFQGRFVFREEHCDPAAPGFAMIVMGVGDTIISVFLLYLFIEPVLKIIRMRSSAAAANSSNKALFAVAKKNLYWSAVMIFSTAVCMGTLGITLNTLERHLISSDDLHLELQWWRPFGFWLILVDLTINTLAVLALYPAAWLPRERRFPGLRYAFGMEDKSSSLERLSAPADTKLSI